MSNVALITGTSSGMGLHAAVDLAKRGMHVVATMRDTARSGALRDAAATAGVEVDVRALDVVDHEAAARLVAQLEAELGGIHVLVNNAGQGSVASAEQLTMGQIQDQLDINYLAPVNLAKLVLPAMRQRGSGRIITVTSVGGAVGQPFADAYCGAKFAVEGFMQSLAVVAERFGVRVSVFEPGAVASSFVANVSRAEEGGPYGALLEAYRSRTAGAFASAQSSESAGAAIAAAVMSDEYRFGGESCERASGFVEGSLADSGGSQVLEFTRPWIAAG